MSAPVVRNDAITMLLKEQHLRVPVIGRQRPPVAKDNGLTLAPVLKINLNAVFRRYRCHRIISDSLESAGQHYSQIKREFVKPRRLDHNEQL